MKKPFLKSKCLEWFHAFHSSVPDEYKQISLNILECIENIFNIGID